MSSKLRKVAAAALLPLSGVPIALAVPEVEREHEAFTALYRDRGALPAPDVAARPQRPVPPTRGRIPVLAYHGIDSGDRYSVTRRAFAEQMELLRALGFEAISVEQYARAIAGEPVRLPRRPVLITFDDGLVSSFRGADAVLEREGLKATMFVITGRADERSRRHLVWDELQAMSDSGRWELQLHAHDGHSRIGPGPFYGNRRPGESREQALRRIAEDIQRGERELSERVDGFRSWTFAVPFSTYGQRGDTNDPQLAERVGALLRRRYRATFVQQDDPKFSERGDAGRAVARFEVHASTSLQDLEIWLRREEKR